MQNEGPNEVHVVRTKSMWSERNPARSTTKLVYTTTETTCSAPFSGFLVHVHVHVHCFHISSLKFTYFLHKKCHLATCSTTLYYNVVLSIINELCHRNYHFRSYFQSFFHCHLLMAAVLVIALFSRSYCSWSVTKTLNTFITFSRSPSHLLTL